MLVVVCVFFFQAEDGIRDLVRSRGLGDVYKRQVLPTGEIIRTPPVPQHASGPDWPRLFLGAEGTFLSLIHI